MTAGMVNVPTIIPLKEPGSILAGSRKYMIDSNTLIDLQTSTKNCLLFYTLDSSKPDPFKKFGEKTTYHFSSPFTLKPGKRTVKAIAVLKDGSKQSSVNTKVFQVTEPQPISDDEEEKMSNTTWAKKSIIGDGADVVDGTRLLKNILKEDIKDEKENEEDFVKRVLTDSPGPGRKTPVHDVDGDNPFRCFHCHTERPRDPYARFCGGCGSSLPPAPGGVRNSYYFNSCTTCQSCGSRISSETSFCGFCDSASNIKQSKERINCTNCSSMNPNTAENCLVCDETLDNAILRDNNTKRKVPKPADEFVQCPFCNRINSGDARFCDWCGKKPHTNSVSIVCEKCNAMSNLYDDHCSSCSEILPTPMRKNFEHKMFNGDIPEASPDNCDNALWKKMNLMKISKRAAKNVATQAGENLVSNTFTTSRSNKLFNLSPGKGYWRQQIEHICHHFKVYAQNNLEFRESIANYIMSRMTSAIAQESKEDLELILTTTFSLQGMGKSKTHMKGAASALTFMNALTKNIKAKECIGPGTMNPRPSSSRPTSSRTRPLSARSRPTSARSRTSSIGSRPGSARKKKKIVKTYEKIEQEKIAVKLSKLSPENLKVLSMIKSSKVIDEEKLEELMKSESFDPNTVDENGIPLLKLSVGCKHFNVIQLLIESGAIIDKTSGIKETTALHEAVSLGITGRDAVDILLEKGASPELKDKRGQTPFDLALESGIDALVEKFTKLTSKQLLNDVKL